MDHSDVVLCRLLADVGVDICRRIMPPEKKNTDQKSTRHSKTQSEQPFATHSETKGTATMVNLRKLQVENRKLFAENYIISSYRLSIGGSGVGGLTGRSQRQNK